MYILSRFKKKKIKCYWVLSSFSRGDDKEERRESIRSTLKSNFQKQYHLHKDQGQFFKESCIFSVLPSVTIILFLLHLYPAPYQRSLYSNTLVPLLCCSVPPYLKWKINTKLKTTPRPMLNSTVLTNQSQTTEIKLFPNIYLQNYL